MSDLREFPQEYAEGESRPEPQEPLARAEESPARERTESITEGPQRERVAELLRTTRTELAQIPESEARSREETGRWVAGILPDGLAEILESRQDITIEDAQRILADTSIHYSRNLPSNIVSFVRHDSADYLNNAVSLNVGPTAATILVNGTYQEGPNGPRYVWEPHLPKSKYGSQRHLHAELDPTTRSVSISASLPGGQELYNITIPTNPSEVNESNSSRFSSTEYFRLNKPQTRRPFEKSTKKHKKRDGRVWDYTSALTRAVHDVALAVPENSKAKAPKVKSAA